ncbi:G-type lectin S-receptor-like serine/threonine-protein kinase At4g27290 [Morus notabilis]|uniref:G-type lectin S-receptor-like serine/threonine-protein kinase At4g27290 n=1 Tax=Morus notabilis TaxID=981085 RepID=UPI000CED4319|nr:G-type lectin S-receptor-like serine/threonine-protein kinase At4g27290 [Morus notabilis]
MKLVVIIFFFSLICFHISLLADDTIKPNQTLLDTVQTLVSTGKKFELGFFSPPNSKNRYVGIWFKNVSELTAIWVANRDNPLADSSGVLKITETGNIVIFSNKTENPIWSSNSSAEDPTLQLLNTGNLVVKDGNSGKYTWQSFDYPCDSLVSGMKLGRDFITGQNWKLTSWNSSQDPSTGILTYEVDPRRLPQALLQRGKNITYRDGPWDGSSKVQVKMAFKPNYLVSETHFYYTFEDTDNSTVTRFCLDPSGSLGQLLWSHDSDKWVIVYAMQRDNCDDFARCGPNGVCDTSNTVICDCPTGFVPKTPNEWASIIFNGGCVRKTRLNCSANERFQKFSRMKLPYNSEFMVNGSVVRKEECELICRRNCSCVAYAVARFGGCVIWAGDLLDMRHFSDAGQDLYIRMAASDFVGGCLICKRTSCCLISQEGTMTPTHLEEDVELPLFGFDTIANATNNFAFTNKIGQGGFGLVYKGVLSSGKEIAVKRLSKDSGQGPVEFKNEVTLISKLQHRNLVRLLGCCIHREERMLIYEFMPKKSLDLYIFNETRETALDWKKRFNIIAGIARGLLYLHRDSRLRIIHRDLKANNVLLDSEINPKISDFGLARILGGDQTDINTKRVVGTYGYMSPEYMMDGHFSVKSDVFSFGVMVLEIVSGKTNRRFEHPDHNLNLLGHAWKLWIEDRPMELIDVLMENVPVAEVLRCIQIGLLCVQKHPEERPLMSSVLFMLESDNALLPQPKLPGFYTERTFIERASSSSSSLNKPNNVSTGVTVTALQGR